MWESGSMTMFESFMISLSGICIVFLTLMVIALMIKITSAIVGGIVKEGEKKAPAKASTPAAAPKAVNKGDDAEVAAIIAAFSEEMKLSVDKFRIVSINEKK